MRTKLSISRSVFCQCLCLFSSYHGERERFRKVPELLGFDSMLGEGERDAYLTTLSRFKFIQRQW
jgi:hypothetical protein